MRNQKKKLSILLAAALLVTPFSMNANVTEAKKKPRITVSIMELFKGETETIKVKNATKKVKWSSTKSSVASVKSTGKASAKIKGKKAGKATIKAKVSGKTLKCTVKVLRLDDDDDSSSSSSSSSYNTPKPVVTQKPTTSSYNTPKPVVTPKPTTSIKINLPTANINTTQYKDGNYTKCKLTSLSYTVTSNGVIINGAVEKTYQKSGSPYTWIGINYKLYKAGTQQVVETSFLVSEENLQVGDQYSFSKKIYDLPAGEYDLVLQDCR